MIIVQRAAHNLSLPALLLAGGVCLAATTRAPAEVTSAQVAAAVQRGVARLRMDLRRLGGPRGGGRDSGVKALILLAMLNAGVASDDPAVVDNLASLARTPDQETYVVALKCQAFAAADPKKYIRPLRAAAEWLIEAQRRQGMWSYRTGRGGRDNSNTQFALLGLHEAAKAGVAVPRQVWDRARVHFEGAQAADGGWSYRGGRQVAYGSMTTAGIASLYICGQRLHVGGKKAFLRGAYPDCGKYRQNRAIAAGLAWLGRNFSVDQNPRAGGRWVFYYLYGVERVGMISGARNLGAHDWYRAGAARLVAVQRPDGGFGSSAIHTAFAMLFLCKGNRPILIQKLRWTHPLRPDEWNRNRHDLEHLTAFVGDKFGEPVTWQTTSLDLPLGELRAGPILLITGHDFPRFDAAQRSKLRRYVASGGTLLFEACCGSKSFQKGFRELAATIYKEVDKEYRLEKLPADHLVFRSYYRLDNSYGLEGIDVGCKTGIFFSPRALSCLWEMGDCRDPRSREALSEAALKLGVNIAAYATGKEQLPDRLARVELSPPAPADRRPDAEVPRGAVRIARLIHDGDYNADPHAMANAAALLRDRAKVDVVARARHLRADDETIYEYPVIFLTGHNTFELPPKEVRALRAYLQRGGFLMADACCGRKEFDASFRKLARQLFPDKPLTALAEDHPIYRGAAGPALGELRFRKCLADERRAAGLPHPDRTSRPPLEAVRLDGRTVILYSKYDFSCALEGDKPYSCRGYADADGRKLALNILLYAISY